jgi:DNA-binding transcriptional LysR family regulator
MHAMHDRSLASIDLNLLVVLRALLNERHVTRAASQVGLSQSATSHALSRLRELYGDPLLVRSGRALVLTPRAQQLLPMLERGLSDLTATVEAEPAFQPRTARRRFRVGMADYAQAFLLGALLRALEREAPGLDLAVLNFPNLEERTISGDIELALHLTGMAPPSLVSEALFEDEFVCMVRRGHPLVKSRLRLERYVQLQHVVVAPTGQAGSPVDTELAKRGLSRRIGLWVSNFLVAPIVVSETDYISTMPRRLAQHLVKRYPLRLLPTPLALPGFGLSLMWHPRLDHDPAHAWLRKLIARVSRAI